MDGWMDEWMDGWMDGWIIRETNGWTDRHISNSLVEYNSNDNVSAIYTTSLPLS